MILSLLLFSVSSFASSSLCVDAKCVLGTVIRANYCEEKNMIIDGQLYRLVRPLFECKKVQCGTGWEFSGKYVPCN